MTFDEPTSDFDDQMQGIQSGVLTHEQTHCKHGVFIGHWAGPDYMCFWCEMGVSDEEYAEAMAHRERIRARKKRAVPYMKVVLRLARRYEQMEAGPDKEAMCRRIERHATFWGAITAL